MLRLFVTLVCVVVPFFASANAARPPSAVEIANAGSVKRTYSIAFSVAPTAAMDIVSVQPPAGTMVRVRRIVITNPGAQTSAGLVTLTVGYAAAAGTGGTAATAQSYGVGDGDAAAGSTMRAGDTTGLATANRLHSWHVWVPGTAADAQPIVLDYDGLRKPPTINGSTASADVFVIRHPGAAGAAGFSGFVEFTEE